MADRFIWICSFTKVFIGIEVSWLVERSRWRSVLVRFWKAVFERWIRILWDRFSFFRIGRCWKVLVGIDVSRLVFK